ncbi:MAG: helix-hairpin-helix domain-containing protein [Halarsenatibacteraceae bacterium]
MKKTDINNFLKILVLSFILISITIAPVQAELEVHFIDVGQGDSILLQEDEGVNVLIDGGNRWNSVEDKVLSYLRQNNVDTIDALISTHPHADHIGSFEAVIANFEVDKIYDSGRIHTSKTYENYLLAIDQNNIDFYTPKRGENFSIEGLNFEVLHPENPAEDYDLNNSSVVLRLQYGEVSFLFTGDIEHEAEREIINSGLNLNSTILKVSHHGSKTSSSRNFLEEVSPEAGVIMVGEDNNFGHPNQETLGALSSKGVKIYRTDQNGDIVIKTDGKSYSIKPSKENNVTEERVLEKTENDDKDKSHLININTASKGQLDSLWGIGPATAEKIINYREKYGPFKSIEEIKNVNGIDVEKFNKWNHKITI